MAELLATMSHDIVVDKNKLPPKQLGPVAQRFEQARWVYLSDVITREEANDLTDYMFDLY